MNLSIDNLMSILLNDFLPFYRFWPPTKPRFDITFVQVTRGGHDIWASGHVLARTQGEAGRFFTVLGFSK